MTFGTKKGGFVTADPATELRKFSRIDARLEAVVEGETGREAAMVENISLNGLYVRLRNSGSILQDEQVRIDIYDKTSEDSTVRLKGRIVRVDGSGLAVHFRPMRLSDYFQLEAVVEHMAEDAARKAMRRISSILIGRIHRKFRRGTN
jgi:hypothetical protein